MRNQFTALIQRGENGWWVATCPEVPGANGQGRTIDEVKANLVEAIELMLDVMREDALAQAGEEVVREVVLVG
jgi:predicted RNase H-like HicB family nuclease